MSRSHTACVLRAALIGAGALSCAESLGPDLVVPIQIVATPDRDTLRLADSLVLVALHDSLVPSQITWTIEPRGDTVSTDTLVYRPRAAGTEFVRALARFDGARAGSAVRRVVTRTNAAPLVAVEVSGGPVARVPLGDTIQLTANVVDPDGDMIEAEARRWYLEDPSDGTVETLIGVGDTVQFPVTEVGALRFHLIVTDAAGARGDARYATEGYDPVTPARWRMRIATSWVTSTTRHPSGRILALVGSGAIPPLKRVVALTDSGRVTWTVDTQLSGVPLMVGDDGGIYHAGGSESGTGQSQTKIVKLAADGSESWTAAEAGAISGPVLLWDGGVAVPRLRGLQVLDPDGRERWTASIDSIDEVLALAVGADSTVYAIGYTSWPGFRASLSAFTPDGSLDWRVQVGANSTRWVMIPAGDSTLLVGADSLYALRRDGSVRWVRPDRFAHPAVCLARAYVASGNELVAVALATGEEAWRVTLPGGSQGAPVLTAAGEVVVPVGATILGLDAGSGQERWRHVLAGSLTSPLLLTASGDLIAGDALGFIEAIPLGAGPLEAAWPMWLSDERRTGRERRP